MEKITEAQVIRIDTKATGARIRELRKKHNLRVEDIRAYINLSDTQAIINGREEQRFHRLKTCSH